MQTPKIKMYFSPLVIWQSRVNGAQYHGENLPVQRWKWPTGTYLERQRQRRIEEARKEQGNAQNNCQD